MIVLGRISSEGQNRPYEVRPGRYRLAGPSFSTATATTTLSRRSVFVVLLLLCASSVLCGRGPIDAGMLLCLFHDSRHFFLEVEHLLTYLLFYLLTYLLTPTNSGICRPPRPRSYCDCRVSFTKRERERERNCWMFASTERIVAARPFFGCGDGWMDGWMDEMLYWIGEMSCHARKSS